MPFSLEARLASRNNAVTLIRLLLAILVVFGHTWEVGGFGEDPIQRITGVTSGEIGVNAFFALSGYLVTQSWSRSFFYSEYLWKRFLRIFPGYWVCLVLTGLVLFPYLWAEQHQLILSAAYHEGIFLDYVKLNLFLRMIQPNIGDLFINHPAAGQVNGSLWSLFPEFLCYIGVLVAGMAGLLAGKRRVLIFVFAGFLYLLHYSGPDIIARMHGHSLEGKVWYVWRVATQATFFAGGLLCYLAAGRIYVSWRNTVVLAGILVFVAMLGAYEWFAPVLLPPLLLLLAALLPGAKLDAVGDYSYGIYVYHYPLQQAFYQLSVNLGNAFGFFSLTLICTIQLAVLSWHLIEKPALGLRHRITNKPVAH